MKNNKAVNNEIRINLGGVVISNIVEDKEIKNWLSNTYSNFISKRKPRASIDIRLGDIPDVIIDRIPKGPNLRIGRSNGKLFFKMPNSGLVLSDVNFRSLTFYLKKRDLDSLIMLHYLLINRLLIPSQGAFIHASAIKINNKAYLFIAPSGGGKTTIANLFPGRNIIHDDQILIKMAGNRFIVSVIPWSLIHVGNHKEEITLDKIFFIDKSKQNYIQPLSRVDSFKRIVNGLMHSLPITDTRALNLLISFFRDLVEKVPCYRLEFSPNRKLVSLLKGFI